MNAIYLFSIRNIPVYVQPWYFLLLAFFGMRQSLTSGLIFAACVTVSLLVHEFGHALVAARYRLNPTVILHGWGGLCAHERAEKDTHDAFIIAAGPGAGFAFGLLNLGIVLAIPDDFLLVRPYLTEVLVNLVQINIIWSFFNMIPLWPLDGGQLARIGILRFTNPNTGERAVHILGLVIAGACTFAAWALLNNGFMMLICVLLGYENYKHMRSRKPSGAIRKRYSHANSLLDNGWKALESAHYAEAARIGHQIRAESSLSQSLDKKAWELIALASLLQGKYEEGLKYAEHAPESPRLIAACINALLIQGKTESARALSQTRAFRKLPLKVKRELARRFDAVSGHQSEG